MAAGIRLPEHSHCKFCGDPVPFGEEYCDEDCRRGEAERVAKEKRRDLLFYVSAGVAIVVIAAWTFSPLWEQLSIDTRARG